MEFSNKFLFCFFFLNIFSDIFENGNDKTKYPFSDSDFGPSAAIWNPYNIDLNSLGKDNSGSGSSTSYSFDSFNPKYNNNPDDSFFENYRFGVADWDTDFSTQRQRGTIGSDMHTSSSSQRSKKMSAPRTSNSKRAVTKIAPKPKQRNQKRVSHQQNKEPDRDLMPPPPKK